ncbi:MAG: 50S ribosomal protein L19 [Patescibacteria group bacterium]
MARQNLTTIQPEEIRTGMKIRVHQKIREKNPKGEEKERIQVFEGLVINLRGSKNHKTMTVRKISDGVGVEKIYPLNLPAIAKIELVAQYKTNRKVLNFVRSTKKRLKEITPKLKSDNPAKANPESDKQDAETEKAA